TNSYCPCMRLTSSAKARCMPPSSWMPCATSATRGRPLPALCTAQSSACRLLHPETHEPRRGHEVAPAQTGCAAVEDERDDEDQGVRDRGDDGRRADAAALEEEGQARDGDGGS